MSCDKSSIHCTGPFRFLTFGNARISSQVKKYHFPNLSSRESFKRKKVQRKGLTWMEDDSYMLKLPVSIKMINSNAIKKWNK